MEFGASGHAAAPTHKFDRVSRPSSVSANAEPPSPRGRLISEGSVHFYAVQPYTPSGTFGATSPYTPGGKLRSTGLVPLRKALSCLQRVAPKGPGVEGTRCDFQKRPELRDTPHPSWAKAHDTFSPGRRLFSETAIPYF